MKLSDLGAKFLRRVLKEDTWTRRKPDGTDEQVTGPREYLLDVESLAEADGVMFLCPKCFADNKGEVGTHSVICWFVGKVPDDVCPKPGRWNPSGTGLHDLTFVGHGAVSVLLTGGGCAWHGFVKNGDAT